jgi:hypothetical protein
MASMNRLATVLALLAVPAALAQGNPDLMKTPGCAAARSQLEAVLGAGGPRDRLAAARERAALACFGVRPAPPPEGRFVPPPVAVEGIQLRSTPALQAGPATPPAAPPPPLAIPRPPVVTACDASGCWDSNGTRYNQQGPVLLGPKGVCTLQAGALNCP